MNAVSSIPDAARQGRALASAQALANAVARVERGLCPVGETTNAAAVPVLLLVLSGLPGSGKSHLARLMQPHLLATIVETDFIRRLLFPQPSYSGPESAWVYAVSHALIARLLAGGQPVIFDATNLREDCRQTLYAIAEHAMARLVIVRTVAPDEVIRQRLLARRDQFDPNDHSEADIAVYDKLRRTEQPIGHRHLVVDTTQTCGHLVDLVLSECRG